MFEKNRNSSLKSYKLCQSNYLSAPALSWDAMPNVTKVKLELISVAERQKGRSSYISMRYSKANNKYLKSYDQKQEEKYIIYLDADNLYRYVISKFLLIGRLKWIHHKTFG